MWGHQNPPWRMGMRTAWVWWGILVCLQAVVQGRTTEFGGYVSGRKVLDPMDSPFEVRKEIVIESDSRLVIRPGVEMRFAPGVGITVQRDGVLEATGEELRRITLTRLVASVSAEEDRRPVAEVRLVDGHSVLEGRLQLFYKGSWRSVCTNSKNWTSESLEVMCRQLGFSGGRLHQWYPRSNDSSQLMYEDPHCRGDETSLFDCPNWRDRKLGNGVCDFHADLGVHCDNYLGIQKSSNWKGINFFNARAKDKEPIENKVKRHYSLSSLQYVDILFAGRDPYGKAVPALDVYGQPPLMKDFSVKYSAFDAISLYKPVDKFVLEDSLIFGNRGHGIFINSSVSQATINGVKIMSNGGNGIHYTHHDSYGTAAAFCNTGTIGEDQIYPVRRSHVQRKDQFYVQNCSQVFEVAGWTGKVLTVNFMGFSSDFTNPRYASLIEVYDGRTESSRLLASVPVMNNTFPESITSTRQTILLKYVPRGGHDASFMVEIIASQGRAYDLNVTNCNITNNLGKGIAVYEQKSGVLVNTSHLHENGYAAGLHVATGCGDVMVNSTLISDNNGDGINITFAGGYVHVDRSSITSNKGRGIAFWFNETSDHVAFNHTVHITRSELVNNTLYGIQMGNQCLAHSLWNISLSAFRGNRDSGILISPCWTHSKASQSNIFVTHNQFLDSDYFALEAFPVLHMHMLIEHNEFRGHERGVMYVGGLDDDDFLRVPAKVEIQYNFFAYNYGKFVVDIGVAKGKSIQELLFYKNELVENSVKEQFHGLNPRSRVCAVVAVSSQNTHVYRNRFENQHSQYQLGSHIEKHEVDINATYNYWGSTKVRDIYEKIFDRKDRYNLARVEFLPFLTYSTDLDTITAVLDEHERDKIIPFRVDTDIGGEVPGSVFLPRNTYTVKRDIYVRPGNGKLHIEPGTILKFDRSVGMMVQGMLVSESDLEVNPITYTINSNPTMDSMQGASNIRLSRNTEGLLEVNINGVWGSVCDYGWDISDASIACNQLGLALHPDEWLLEQSEFDSSTRDAILSNVQCTLQDTDITLCKAERNFEGVCDRKVGLRCYRPSWAGLRLGMAASESRLKNVVVEFAGLFDYATNSFKPALQIDFNRHHLEKLTIRNNTDSGLGIMWNEVFVSESRQLIDSQFLTNHRHGLVVHTQGLNIYNCKMYNNDGSGIHYNPMFSKVEQRDLISWINLKEQNKVINVPDDIKGDIFLNNNEYRYLVFTQGSAIKEFSITTTSGRSIGVVVLNSFKEASTENMVIYGRLEKGEDVPQWDIRSNLTAFPLRTPGYGALFEYKSGTNPSGEAIIYIASVDGQRSKPLWETHPKIHINSVSIRNCGRGISSYHFNRDVSDHGDHFHRYSNETILITNSDISLSNSEAVFVWAPFWDPFIKNLAEINYTLINCTIRENRKALLHYSRDIRNSNNLFHWTINNTVFEFNDEGGIDIRLPYVWQYSENFTHSFAMHDCSLRNNRKFEFSISGHFARVNVTRCLFQNNFCKKGILSFSGMEKELLIESNIIKANSAFFGVEFNLQSHANQFGLVSASFRKNFVTANRDIGDNQKFGYQPTSYAIGVRGVQLINITRNILENPNLQFELLTGVLTGSIDNRINVASNWWNSTEPFEIQKRIFDFDDWNGYAIADFSPYLAEPNIDGRLLTFDNTEQSILREDHLGGRLYEDYRLSYKTDPYVVSSDLTVMPGASLFIAPGVVVEFYPSVGILVLGDLIAEGTQANPILMRPARITNEGRFRRQSEIPMSRLCVDEKCDTVRSDGFLEIYNATTQQWVPICDARFTERNAQVVCRELKQSTLNVHMYFGPRLDMGPTQTSHIRSWPHPLECLGTESSLEDCEYRLNGYIDNYKCPFDGDFVYVYCGPDALPDYEDHWGGIRFSIPDFETTVSAFNSPTLDYSAPRSSRLEYVHIQGAGILHNEKSSAIQLVQREVTMNFVNISESASHGVEVIGVSGNLVFNEMVVTNNLGVGMNFLSLEGDSADGLQVGYTPLTGVDMSYNVFGMVDMCDINKEMEIENRILLYYKYNNQPVDCVKIFSSRHYGKQIGFRLLQFNLFDGAKYAAQPDSIQIFDGDVFNITSPHLANITWGNAENSTKVFYKSTDTTLSVILHTIGGSEYSGFIAEVVTLPIFKASVSDSQHNISYSVLSNNGKQGIAYRSAGEITPDITLRYNRVINNGKELFGNFTVGDSAVLLDVQNSKALYFYNNLIMKNQGGLQLRVDSYTSVSAIKGMIVNNLFTENRNREALVLEGGKSGSFQFVTVMRNYFARNYAQYRDTMVISQVKANFSDNVASNNTGKHLLDVYGFENQPLSFQMCVKNWFWKNIATDYWDKSTIIASKAGQTFKYNYLLNPDNDFELATKNRPIYYYSSRVNPVNARMNWWGFNGTAAVSGRVKDYYDYEELLEVDFQPFLHDNTSVLSGKCAGGWKQIGDTCFLYVGGVMTYAEAKRFCEMDNASMPYVKTKHDELMAFVRERQLYYQHYSDRFWIQSLDISPRECAVLVNRRVVRHSCEEYFPFLCERDPEITVSASLLFMEPVTIAFLSVAALSLLFIAMCIGFWLCKSRQRYKEKLERRNSIRASIRSNRSLTGFSELGYKRRMERAFDTESSKAPELKMNGSLDSVEKSASRFSCSLDESFENNTVGDTSSSRVPNGDFSGFGGFHHDAQHENRTANLMVHPTFDLTYENQCFVDRSVSRNSHDVSRDWSSSTGSTLDMKRALERETKEQTPYHVGPYRQSPSPNLTLESNDGSSRSSSRQPPLETAM